MASATSFCTFLVYEMREVSKINSLCLLLLYPSTGLGRENNEGRHMQGEKVVRGDESVEYE